MEIYVYHNFTQRYTHQNVGILIFFYLETKNNEARSKFSLNFAQNYVEVKSVDH